DWTAGVDAALQRPERVFVSRAGDRFAPDGWRVGMTGSGATGHALEEALRRAESAISVLDDCRRTLEGADDGLAVATQRCDKLSADLAAASASKERARERLGTVESDLRATRVEGEALKSQLDAMRVKLVADSERQSALTAALPELEQGEQLALELSQARNEARDELERDAAGIAALRSGLDVRAAGMEERRAVLETRLAEVDARLERSASQRAEATERRQHLEKRLALAGILRSVVESRGEQIELDLTQLRERRRAQSDAAKAASLRLDELRRSRAESERQLGEIRELLTRNELHEGEVSMKLEAAIEALRRDHGCEPARAVETECPPLDGVTPAARVRELERELRIMGPINPLALEEYEALNERQQFLQDQLDDVRNSRRELSKVIRAVDAEIVQIFSAAFSDVSENFEHLFGTLFPGGVGKLKLTAPDDLLNTGIDLEAKPSGKNVKKLSLLSGGERSLTALAFLFAVFRSRPSPFYVMDEVEAALDDVNLHRFLQLVAEFRDEAQLIIVSHQKRTMEAADCLYGITMQPGGSSRALSERPGVDIDLTEPEHQGRAVSGHI
ncbi:MAG: AAA family ATPase, partial [Acidimicrobiales bacterium]